MTYKSPRILLAALAAVLMTLMAAAPALADPPKETKKRSKIVFLPDDEGSKVVGYVHRPEVSYIISRPEMEDLEILELKEDFIKLIIESVNHPPF